MVGTGGHGSEIWKILILITFFHKGFFCELLPSSPLFSIMINSKIHKRQIPEGEKQERFNGAWRERNAQGQSKVGDPWQRRVRYPSWSLGQRGALTFSSYRTQI